MCTVPYSAFLIKTILRMRKIERAQTHNGMLPAFCS
jgi:hypothetical protein